MQANDLGNETKCSYTTHAIRQQSSRNIIYFSELRKPLSRLSGFSEVDLASLASTLGKSARLKSRLTKRKVLTKENAKYLPMACKVLAKPVGVSCKTYKAYRHLHVLLCTC